MDKTANRNTFWAHMIVEELQRSGLATVVIAPGSRSTPLALAFGSQARLNVVVHPDERGAAFFALGAALASAKPVAVLCTSGTAAANFYPAVVEAHQSHVPLLILTADRPAELRDSGANQTIDQVKLFGGYVGWAVEIPMPEANPSQTLVQALRSLANRAMAIASGPPAGPVHLNIPFRKPLEPIPIPGEVPQSEAAVVDWPGDEESSRPAQVQFSAGRLIATDAQIEALAAAVCHTRRGLIYCGPRCPGGSFPAAVFHFSQLTGFPIFADALSGLRFHPAVSQESAGLIGGYETFLASPVLAELGEPDLIVQFGALPISKALGDYLASVKSTRRIQIQPSRAWADEAFNTTEFLLAEPEQVVRDLINTLPSDCRAHVDSAWVEALRHAERLAWQAVAETRQAGFFEGALLAEILETLEDGDSLFTASSLPVRHLDQFGQPQAKNLRLFANRGASGIDGTIASACGAAAAGGLNRHLVLVIGDLAFLHDLNSLLYLHHDPQNMSIVLINNDGGGIFQHLPIADAAKRSGFEELFEQLFTVPHGLRFEHAAQLFHLDYTQIDPAHGLTSDQNVSAALRRTLKTRRPHIIEIITNAAAHEQSRRETLRRFAQLWQQPQEIHSAEIYS